MILTGPRTDCGLACVGQWHQQGISSQVVKGEMKMIALLLVILIVLVSCAQILSVPCIVCKRFWMAGSCGINKGLPLWPAILWVEYHISLLGICYADGI